MSRIKRRRGDTVGPLPYVAIGLAIVVLLLVLNLPEDERPSGSDRTSTPGTQPNAAVETGNSSGYTSATSPDHPRGGWPRGGSVAHIVETGYGSAEVDVRAKLVEIATRSAVEIVARPRGSKNNKDDQPGSGVIVTTGSNVDTYVITNYHVIDYLDGDDIYGCDCPAGALKNILVEPFSMSTVETPNLGACANVVHCAPTEDLALLQLGRPHGNRRDDLHCVAEKLGNFGVAIALSTEPPKLSEQVWAIGNQWDLGGTMSNGRITSLNPRNPKRDMPGEREWTNKIAHSADIGTGSSGGALLNDDGLLVGVNWGVLTGTGHPVSLAIRARAVADFISRGIACFRE